MDTIQDTPEETSGAPTARFWKPKSPSKADVARPAKARGRPFSHDTDWRLLVGAGVAIGAVLGAGIALLMAPQSGAHTRLALGKEIRRRRPWRHNPWDQLGRELREVARRRRPSSRSTGLD
jgi:hypothetical protein